MYLFPYIYEGGRSSSQYLSHIYLLTYTSKRLYMYMYTYVYIYIYVYICVYIHIYMYIYIYVDGTCKNSKVL